ncbi:MAG TPA: hypothetical protein PKK18_06080 [Chitinophagales bacterium]|nr:hypothetical protein [Chitinophagales bacterium]HMW11575.1 hypothetical protein [Chitinophagales bacterium]HMX60882.1 hypothetical protein [Chitinophagales bacterium]HMY24001.1 hypothetical protein [Chitinophagales bacterium]HMZ32610.1 hypothetical protein [Chitinophagales bacterium]
MKNLTLLLLSLVLFTSVCIAQSNKVVLCESYDKTTGEASGINKNWDVDSKTGSYVYIVYSQATNIKDKLMLYVDKKSTSGSYTAFDTQDFTFDPKVDKKKWAMFDYKFTESGDYRISVMGSGDEPLASTYTNIGYMKENPSDKDKSTDNEDGDEYDTYYYENSTITFGDEVDNDANVKGEATEFKLINGKRDIMLKLEQDDDLKCKEVEVSVYYGDKYDEEVSRETYSVESMTWNWLKFKISVKKVGKYVVDIYNDKDVFINSGYFEVIK